MRQFFPYWSLTQQVTAYAILGGIPTYWEQFEPRHSIETNIQARSGFTAGFKKQAQGVGVWLVDLSDMNLVA